MSDLAGLLFSCAAELANVWSSSAPVMEILAAYQLAPAVPLSLVATTFLQSLANSAKSGTLSLETGIYTGFFRDNEILQKDSFGLTRQLHHQLKYRVFHNEDGQKIIREKNIPPLDLAGEIDLVFDLLFDRLIDSFHVLRSDPQRQLEDYLEIIDRYVIMSKTDPQGVITYASQALCKISGFSREELLGKSHNVLRHSEMPNSVFMNLWRTIQVGKVWSGEIKNRKKDGGSFWVEVTITPVQNRWGHFCGYLAVRHDITDRKLVYTDPLTKIYNRLKFDDQLNNEVNMAQRYEREFGLIIIDIDDFKKVNDRFGHSAGDQVLVKLAACISAEIRDTDTFARWGGEEFVVLAHGSHGQIARLAERLRFLVETMQMPQPLQPVTCSFGVASFRSGDSAESLFRRADAYLYKAKNNGKNRVVNDENYLTITPGWYRLD